MHPATHFIKQRFSDASLLKQFVRGDALAFDVLYQRHRDGLFNFVLRAMPATLAEELAQDVWQVVIESADQFAHNSSVRTWLFQIASHKIADYWRNPRRTGEACSDSSELDGLASHYDVETLRLHQELRRNIGHLPIEQQHTLLLQAQGFDYQTIAEILQTNLETTKSRLRYARASLAATMGDVK